METRHAINATSPLEVELKILKSKFQNHTDGMLKRFLRAFKTVEKASEMLLKYDKWRLDFNVDGLSESDEDIKNEILTEKAILLPHRDLSGRPILFIRVRKHNAYERNVEKLTKFIVYMLEQAIKKCNEDIIDTLCIVFDLHNFGMANMDYQFVQQLIWLLSCRYPERLGICLILNSSWVFTGCWTIIKPWIPSATSEKVVFADKKSLQQYVHHDMLPTDCILE